jgi:hypothetical protein
MPWDAVMCEHIDRSRWAPVQRLQVVPSSWLSNEPGVEHRDGTDIAVAVPAGVGDGGNRDIMFDHSAEAVGDGRS